MKLQTTLFLLLITIIPMSCSVNQNEVTLDKMTGKWELISYVHGYDDALSDYVTESRYNRYITIIKETNNTGVWREDYYKRSDSLLYQSVDHELKIKESGIICALKEGMSTLFFYDYTDYEVSFEGQNLILTNERRIKKTETTMGNSVKIKTLSRIE